MVSKAGLREHMRQRLRSQEPEERRKRSLLIEERFLQMDAYRKARLVLYYVSMPQEVDTFRLMESALAQGKRVAVPACDTAGTDLGVYELSSLGQLRPGTLGILEPEVSTCEAVVLAEIDLVVVPGLAYDLRKNRLGRGKGYYDRFLSRLPESVPKVALAFDFQIVDEVPVEDHDVPLDVVLTDRRKIR
ncbi:MAG: hypothetical protein MOGMAGMI_02204 [Candidatus Omnitrophica bacterium]|nr:hypothetical protein [Candidatus Omnitrophota bacterium]